MRHNAGTLDTKVERAWQNQSRALNPPLIPNVLWHGRGYWPILQAYLPINPR